MSSSACSYRAIGSTTLLSPVPVTLVSCRGVQPEARANALAVAWCGTVNSHPPMVSISLKPERFSCGLIEESGEFVVNLVGEEQCRQLDYCGVRSGRDEDKLAACGLQTRPAQGLMYAPAIEGCPAALSCQVRQRIPLGSHILFLGEVVAVSVREDLFNPDGSLHLERARLISYTHGVYQPASAPIGFFGYSVAKADVLKRRMETLLIK